MTQSDQSALSQIPPFGPRSDTKTPTFRAHHLHYAQLMCESLGGPFHEQNPSTLEGVRRVLDLGCGTGAWPIIVASLYPHMHITGIDATDSAILTAKEIAWAEQMEVQLAFETMHPTELRFPDNSFDLINADTISWRVATRKNWPQILKEAVRVVRPGGIIRVLELEAAISNSEANQHLYGSLVEALHTAGLSYSVDGRTFGFVPTLKYLLLEAGCSDVQMSISVVDVSSGTPFHNGWRDNLIVTNRFTTPFVISTGVVSQEEREAWFEQMKQEVNEKWYRCGLLYVTAWGKKSAD